MVVRKKLPALGTSFESSEDESVDMITMSHSRKVIQFMQTGWANISSQANQVFKLQKKGGRQLLDLDSSSDNNESSGEEELFDSDGNECSDEEAGAGENFLSMWSNDYSTFYQVH